MAGIGFQLRRLLKEGSPSGMLKAYTYAAVISSGPWLCSILCLGALTYLASRRIGEQEVQLFRTLVIYCYAASLVALGPFQMAFTRHIADRLYLGDDKALAPAFLSSTLFLAALQGLTAAIALSFLDLTPSCRLYAGSLYVITSLIWHAMLFLSAARDYGSIVWAFVAGSAVSVAASWTLGERLGALGYLMGFTFGQALLWALLASRVLVEFRAEQALDSAILGSVRRFQTLAWIGLLANLGIWIDKAVFWVSAEGRSVLGFLRVCDPYDSGMFLAYLTVVPAFSLFLARVETDFYDAYREFFGVILKKRGWKAIAERHRLLGEALERGLGAILKYQGMLTALCLLFAEPLARLGRLSPDGAAVFRVGVLGAFLHVIFLFILIFMLYLDLRRLALAMSALFCALCLGLTLLTLRMGPSFYGYGYAGAGLISAVTGYLALGWAFRKLPFYTFARQPLVAPLAEEED